MRRGAIVRWLVALGAVGAGVVALTAVVGGVGRDGAEAGGRDGPPLAAARVDEHLGAPIPLELRFTDLAGRSRALGDVVRSAADGAIAGASSNGGSGQVGQPTLLILAYYGCETLCDLVLEGTARALGEVEWRAGREYHVVVVSIDPRDTPADMRVKVAELQPLLRRSAPSSQTTDGPDAIRGWTFLAGGEPAISALTDAVGFRYRYDRATDQYAHPAVVVALTPTGEVSSYVYGVNPEPNELAMALATAAAGGTRSPVERILLRCFHYIPALRRHAGTIALILRTGGMLTLLAVAALFWRLVLRAPRRAVVR